MQAVAEAHPDKRIEAWFQDEARFRQQGTLTRNWARAGSRPPAVRQTRYDYLCVVGAACPATGQAVGLLSPHLNTEVVNAFFEQFAQEVDPGVHVVMFWDQAGFRTARKLKPPPNLTMIPLPPYCPELNPIENLWHYLRSHHWSNHAFDDYDDLRRAGRDAWHATRLNPELVKTVCRCGYPR